MPNNKLEKSSSDAGKWLSERGRDHDARKAVAHSSNRRRILKGIAGSSPVVMTVISRPALGAAAMCWSGNMSGNLSNIHLDCVTGHKPSVYRNSYSVWPPGYSADTPFGKLFEGARGNSIADKSVMQVLEGHSDDLRPIAPANNFGRHAATTYFNALNLPEFALKPNKALEIINSMYAMGDYKDENGRVWNAREVKLYFRGLQS